MTWNTNEIKSYSNVSTTQGPFTLRGGAYGVTVHAGTWSSGSVKLQRLAADGATYISVGADFTADGYAAVDLPGGTYEFVIASASAVYADIASIVTTM